MAENNAGHPLISVVILSYNRCDDLRRSLEHVYSMEYHPFEVIVADNASTDGTQEMIARIFPKAIFKLSIIGT